MHHASENISCILGTWGKSEISYSVDGRLGKLICRKCVLMSIKVIAIFLYKLVWILTNLVSVKIG